jgi:HTH-type transcriptional regulator/antitoxin HigA
VIKVIKTEAEYEVSRSALETLVENDPAPGTPEADRLELLTILIQDFERRVSARELPDAVTAIRFRMEQLGLSQNDLVPFLGSKSRVSEVLSGKRQLSLAMIRALQTGLGIPAQVLVQGGEPATSEIQDIDWGRFPVREMEKRGWLVSLPAIGKSKKDSEVLLTNFFAPVGVERAFAGLHRKSWNVRSARTMDVFALGAWTAQILRRAKSRPPQVPYDPKFLTSEFFQKLAQSSLDEDGPLRAQQMLADIGIALVIESHLPKTHLDGAAVLLSPGRPVIGITARHDRLDSFWFTLFHECAHVLLHLRSGEGVSAFYDDLDVSGGEDEREKEADQFARETLIPEKVWLASPASKVRAPSAVVHLAAQLKIHPAIVAGRVRNQYKDYRVFGELVAPGGVRRFFPDVAWG